MTPFIPIGIAQPNQPSHELTNFAPVTGLELVVVPQRPRDGRAAPSYVVPAIGL